MQTPSNGGGDAPESAIAIVGTKYRFPGISDDQDFLDVLSGGGETISHFTRQELLDAGVPPERADHPDYVPAKGVVPGIEYFDHEFFGIAQDRATLMDPQHRWFLEYAWQALENAGYAPGTFDARTGVFAGSAFNTYLLNNLRHADPSLKQRFNSIELLITTDKDFLATQAAYHLDLRGPAMTVQTACSTSLVAVHLASQSLLLHECDMALAGTVTLYSPQVKGYIYEPGSLISPDGHVRSFDADGQGTVYSSGIGIVVLKRLEDALADRDTIRAVIRGSAVNNDGARKGQFKAPSEEGIADVVADALDISGVSPETIGFLEANGSGTQWGDPIEVSGLAKGWGEHGVDGGSCGMSAVKANLGHLNVVAGMASLLKAMLAVERAVMPPAANFKRPNEQIDFEGGPFHVVTEPQGWPDGDHPRRAAVNSYGVGGTNAHTILEQWPQQARGDHAGGSAVLLPVSARTPSSLERSAAELADWLEQHPSTPLTDIAYTLQVGRLPFPHRRFVVASDHGQAASRLRTTSADGRAVPSSPEPPAILVGETGLDAETLRELLRQAPLLQEPFRAAAAAIEAAGGHGVDALLNGSVAPAPVTAFAAGYALGRYWQLALGGEVSPVGAGVGGHVAAALAGTLSLEDAARLAVERAAGSDGTRTESAASQSGGGAVDVLAVASRGIEAVREELGRLWAAGASVAWSSLWPDRPAFRVPLPTYSFDKVRCYVDIPTAAKPSNYDAAL